MSSFHPLSVKNITRETDKSITISFNLPKNLKDTFAFKAGQYITLKTEIDGNEIRRDYSLCVPPKSNSLKIAVKEVNDGAFSSYANNTLKVGDTLSVAPPKGRFIFEPNNSNTKNIALFAAGSGITPVLSILKCALEEEKNSKVFLIYGNKTVDDTMFFDELTDLKNKYKTRFSIQFVFSQKDEDDAIFGRIEKSTVNYVLKSMFNDEVIDDYYLCGPEAMILNVKKVLLGQNVAENRIHFELFKAAKPQDLKEDLAPVSSGKTKITVTVDDETSSFEMSSKQTILEAALDEDLDAPYSCQGGICSSCLARVKEGEATMRQNTVLTDKEVAEGLILTCQAHPTTPTLVVDYDDV